jgi:hypothetical protein
MQAFHKHRHTSECAAGYTINMFEFEFPTGTGDNRCCAAIVAVSAAPTRQ